MTPTKYVTYCRVSTNEQGTSGLGLEAQHAVIQQYVQAGATAGIVIKEFREVESGARADRPELQAALQHCKLTGAVLLVAKLDRLSRDLGFIVSLEKSGVAFTVCDFPTANSFTIHIFAALAQYERELISQRTTAALAQLKARGQRLGSPGNLTVDAAARGRTAARAVRQQRSASHAAQVGPLVEQYRAAGMSLTAIAERLTAEHVLTPRGGNQWTATAVRRLTA